MKLLAATTERPDHFTESLVGGLIGSAMNIGGQIGSALIGTSAQKSIAKIDAKTQTFVSLNRQQTELAVDRGATERARIQAQAMTGSVRTVATFAFLAFGLWVLMPPAETPRRRHRREDRDEN